MVQHPRVFHIWKQPSWNYEASTPTATPQIARSSKVEFRLQIKIRDYFLNTEARNVSLPMLHAFQTMYLSRNIKYDFLDEPLSPLKQQHILWFSTPGITVFPLIGWVSLWSFQTYLSHLQPDIQNSKLSVSGLDLNQRSGIPALHRYTTCAPLRLVPL